MNLNNIDAYNKLPLVSVIMTTYNVEEYVERAINSILNQTYRKIELIIVDDCSTDDTIAVIKSYNDPRIKLFQNTINAGTFFCKNYGISISKGDYIAIQDSDDYSSPIRIERQLDFFENNPESVIVKCQYVRVNQHGTLLTEPKAAFQASLIRKKVFEEMGYYDTVRAAGDDEFDSRAKKFYGYKRVSILPELLYYNLHRSESLTNTIKIGGDERVEYVKSYQKWHASVRSDSLFMPYPHINRKFKIHSLLQVKDTNLSSKRFKRIRIKADYVTATVVSIKKREKEFEFVVNDILPQVDKLIVYLNDYSTIPKFLKKRKIKVYLADKYAGDIGDNGKFYNIDQLFGFHFTIDDDINYPSDYVKKLKSKLELYTYQACVGLHGIDIVYDNFKSYYDLQSRVVYSFRHSLKNDKQVHLLGTGTVAYHTATAKFDYTEINHRFMVDIFFGIQMCRKQIPLIAISREKGWLKEYDIEEDQSIYDKHKRSDIIQTKLILENFLGKPSFFQPKKEKKTESNEDNQKLYLELEKKEIQIKQLQNQVEVLTSEIKRVEEEKEWYSRTYDHLPLPYLKMGSIFRRVKVKKGFE